VNGHSTLFCGSLGICEQCHLQSACDTVVRKKLESELIGVFCLDAVSDLLGMLVVASSATVVNEDVVFRVLFAPKLLRRF
jgi:hypothetical protein